jgi:hypothetical protein
MKIKIEELNKKGITLIQKDNGKTFIRRKKKRTVLVGGIN